MSRPRTSLTLLVALVLVLCASTSAQASPGDLDTAFGTGGISIPVSGDDWDDAEPTDIAVAPDGKVVVVGRLAGPTNAYAFILRLLPSGALDPDFATGGVLLTRLGPEFAKFSSVIVMPDSRIVVSGSLRTSGQDYPVIAKFTSQGGLDTTFNPLGGLPGVNVNTTLAVNNAEFTDMAMRPDGSFVGTGTIDGAYEYWFAEAVTAGGQLDTSFNGTGYRTTEFLTYWSESADIVARPDGRTVACGHGASSSVDQVNEAFVGYSAAGTYDGQFNGNGFVVRADAATNNHCRALALQSDGKLVSAAVATDGSSSNWLELTRLNANGTPDTGFANGGKYVDDRAEQGTPAGLEVQPDGRILAIGRARLDDLTGYTVWARTPSGAPDPTFGNNGFARYVLDGEGPSAGALQGNQRLFMVGVNDAKVRVLSVKLQPDPLPVLPSSARATITSPTRSKLKRTKLTKISGTATATNGSVGSVEVAILKSGPKKSKSCRWVKDTKAKFRSVRKTKAGCKRHVWIKASGTTKWTLKLKKSLPIGKYTIYARATPAGGVPEASFSKALRNTRSIKLTR